MPRKAYRGKDSNPHQESSLVLSCPPTRIRVASPPSQMPVLQAAQQMHVEIIRESISVVCELELDNWKIDKRMKCASCRVPESTAPHHHIKGWLLAPRATLCRTITLMLSVVRELHPPHYALSHSSFRQKCPSRSLVSLQNVIHQKRRYRLHSSPGQK